MDRGLNAPYGAPCFLTVLVWANLHRLTACLNAPYGAPRFLTSEIADALGISTRS